MEPQEESKRTTDTHMLKIFVGFLIGLQLLIIGFLVKHIYLLKTNPKVMGVSDTITGPGDNPFFIPENSGFNFYHELKPSQIIKRVNANGIETQVTVNKEGLNERYDYSPDKPANTYRIVALGDSFTYGQGVNTKDNWTEQLEDMLNNHLLCGGQTHYEVINLGMQGFDIPYITKMYINHGIKYNPDLILWFESGSGFYRDREIMDPLIKACQDENPADTQEEKDKTYLNCWVRVQNNLKNDTPISTFRKRLQDRINNFLRVKGPTPLVIASTPYVFLDSGIEPNEKEILKKIDSEREDVYFTTNITPIKFSSGNAIALNDGHPNEKGHMQIAADILKYLKLHKEIGLSCTD